MHNLTTNKVLSDNKENYFNNLLKTVKINAFNSSNFCHGNESNKILFQTQQTKKLQQKKISMLFLVLHIQTSIQKIRKIISKQEKFRILPSYI